MASAPDGVRRLSEIERYHLAAQFLGTEAMLLDDGRLEEWLELLADDLLYEMPIREATSNRSEETAGGGFRIRDTKAMIRTRVERFATHNAHAESPPSRTVRAIGSICVLPPQCPDVIQVSSSLILHRQRGTDPLGDTLHARRSDRLRITGGGTRLLARTVLTAESSLSMPNLGIFL